ncbi:MAG: isoamylase early set domain-containing protein [Kiritimatiellia bacterium]|jgi:1,4-alpha-glucan branching enzyme|nr:isoamylase early set domain-containing protein [Kiritimatiellia bacterium]MDP6630185.1 isoamylase early set domain-containing protein [Kiritimatiellia bacterium]MDP6810727.1 isoamylase early set domain-containing protein [Kiritimatiellia bacterium]MDP7023286.1 isoamylase early set domain-containing protein [Kiritimatiellia bacterium]
MGAQVKRRRVKFHIQADENSRVSVAGSFNDWNPKKHVLKQKDGEYALNVLLEPGQYQYKFVVNDIWCVDPEREDWAANDFGSLNSVLTVA